MVLKRALGERWSRWGRDFVDPQSFTEPTGRGDRPLGVRVYTGYTAEFDLRRLNKSQKARLVLTVDAKAKVEQSTTVHDILRDISRSGRWTKQERDEAKRRLEGESVLTSYDKRNFTIYGIEFDQNAETLMIPGVGSHAAYFKDSKGIPLQFPKDPMIQSKGRSNMKIYLPPELLHTTELSKDVKAKLPQIAGFVPELRVNNLRNFVRFLEPGAQKTKGLQGLLPGIGLRVSGKNMPVQVVHMSVPTLQALGIQVCEPLSCCRGKNID